MCIPKGIYISLFFISGKAFAAFKPPLKGEVLSEAKRRG